MTIRLNPYAQAEVEVEALLEQMGAWAGPDAGIQKQIMDIIQRALLGERLAMGEHEDCGEDNPEGIAGKCKCYCHKGHYRHMWTPVIKTPVLNPDGSYHLLDRCKYCPDMRLKIIKAEFGKDGKHTLVNLEYLIRGEQRVLSREEWLQKEPRKVEGELKRETGL